MPTSAPGPASPSRARCSRCWRRSASRSSRSSSGRSPSLWRWIRVGNPFKNAQREAGHHPRARRHGPGPRDEAHARRAAAELHEARRARRVPPARHLEPVDVAGRLVHLLDRARIRRATASSTSSRAIPAPTRRCSRRRTSGRRSGCSTSAATWSRSRSRRSSSSRRARPSGSSSATRTSSRSSSACRSPSRRSRFRGLLLSGMCVPDLRGSQGTFSFFSTESRDGKAAFTGGEQTVLRRGKDGRIRSRIVGPDNCDEPRGRADDAALHARPGRTNGARLEIDGGPAVEPRARPLLRVGHADLQGGPRRQGVGDRPLLPRVARARGPALHDADPHRPGEAGDADQPSRGLRGVPRQEARPLSPRSASPRTRGRSTSASSTSRRSSTRRWPSATSARRCSSTRSRSVKKGLVTTVFDTTDRVQHMFYRYLDPSHPANRGKDTTAPRGRDPAGVRADGRDSRHACSTEADDPDTVVMVISDHGFTNFRRGVNLNAWLRDHGYLVLKDGADDVGRLVRGGRLEPDARVQPRAHRALHQPEGARDVGDRRGGRRVRRAHRGDRPEARALVDPATARPAIRKVEIADRLFDGPQKLRRARPPRRLRGRLPEQLGVRDRRRHRGRLLRQHEELERRPLRRSRHRPRRLLLQPSDHGREARTSSTSPSRCSGSSGRSRRRR